MIEFFKGGWGVVRLVIMITALVVVGKYVALPLFIADTAVNTATGVASKTFDPNNVIVKYEWFHDANGAYLSRIGQIKSTKDELNSESDPQEKIRLRTELNAQRQSCRDIVTQYNANSNKTNVNMFKGREAPVTLDLQTCEG